ncbi:MAG: aspartate kinase [Longimicrobiaceae bacterium]
MPLIVRKYGGTSLGTPGRIRTVAGRVARARAGGDDLVVVVSAMGSATDELISLARETAGHDLAASSHPREFDMLLSAGERVSMALLAMAIREHGTEAISFTGSQAAIITDEAHTSARITEVRAERVRKEVGRGRVVIVAGFQGVSRLREVTTLGRGGSDTTAVALAAALPAERCDIYTDVEGVFTADPRRVPEARRIGELSYDEATELAAAGARVMHPRALEIASRFGVAVRVFSSFAEEGDAAVGTLIHRTPRKVEGLVLTGIASRPGQAKLVVRGLGKGLEPLTRLLSELAGAGVSVDMVSEAGEGARLQLSLSEERLDQARALCERVAPEATVSAEGGLTRVSLVGSGMHDRPGVYARACEALLESGARLHGVSTSSISISLLISGDAEERALQALHRCFELDRVPEAAP